MKKQAFVETRASRWDRFERLLKRFETSGLVACEEHELDELVHMYRLSCSDLARTRSERLGSDIEAYLNALVTRGYKHLHPPERPEIRAIWRFLSKDFPLAVRGIRGYVITASLLFAVPIVVCAIAVSNRPALAYALSPPAALDALTDAYREGHQGGRSESTDTGMAGYYIHNNIGIAFRCFATGVFFGLGSAFFLIINGIFSGAIGAHICNAGYADNFLSFVIGHGAFELIAIVLSGATGLRMGAILVNPGPFRRLYALKAEGPSIVRVILGAALMLLIAAFVEGFWSPSGAPSTVKLAIGGVMWISVILYLTLAGRRQDGLPDEI